EELFEVSRGLANAVLVLDERDADEAFTILTKAQPGRHGDARLLDKQLRELDRAEIPERGRHRRPGEHGRGRRRDRPAGTLEGLNQAVAALSVDGARFLDALLRPVERGGSSDLDRREGAVVEIRLNARERGDETLVADREAHAPARHV